MWCASALERQPHLLLTAQHHPSCSQKELAKGAAIGCHRDFNRDMSFYIEWTWIPGPFNRDFNRILHAHGSGPREFDHPLREKGVEGGGTGLFST
jgi:hypothetical protein